MSNDEAPELRSVGRYQVLSELGRGAMGIVYKGHDPVIGRTVALKTIAFSDDVDNVDLLRQRLYREACSAGTLAHPNIVTVYDIIEESGMTAVAMEFIEGQTLKETIAEAAPMRFDSALDIFEQIIAALDYASQKDIVHRDIKPANIMITPDSRIKVADFGLARSSTSNLTKVSTILGTPSYMSPEQARGATLDGRSDVFSATVVLYEMMTKAKPFMGRNLIETMDRIINSPPTPPSQYNAAISPKVSAVFEKAFAKDPEQRYRTGAEVVSAMRQAIAPRPAVVVPSVDQDAQTMRLPAPVAVDPALQTRRVEAPSPTFDPLLGHDPVLQTVSLTTPPKKSNTRNVGIAIGAAAVILVSIGFVAIGQLKKDPVATTTAGTSRGAAPVTTPVAAESRPPAASVPPVSSTTGSPAGTPVSSARVDPPATLETPSGGRSAANGTAPPPAGRETTKPATASVRFEFDGAAFPLTLLADGKSVGRASESGSAVTVSAGRVKLRAVNDQMFFDQDFGTVTLGANERKTLSVAGTAGVFVGVRGDNYTGLKILLDGKLLPGPYPAQLPRVGATKHKIQFRWTEGALQDLDIADTIDLSDGKQFTIRAIPDAGQVTVQKLR